MMPPDQNQGQQRGEEAQVPAAQGQERPKDRTPTRRRWIKAAGLAAVPLVITVKAQPAFAAGGTVATNAHGSVTPKKKNK